MLFIVVLPLLVIGLALLVRGLRGDAIDDHPVCRRCGFDLVGLPKTSGRCSECGADLAVGGAVRLGNRRRRAGLILGGVVLLLPSVAGLVLVVVATASDVAWIEYAPQWYLLRQARDPMPAVHDPALAEFQRRFTAGSLSDAQVGALVDAGMALQADASATWVPEWGDLIESARSGGKVPDEKWRRYLANAPAFALQVRPEVRRGEPLVFYIREVPARCGQHRTLWVRTRLKVQPDSDLLVPPYQPEQGASNTTLSPHGSGAVGHNLKPAPALLVKAADGPKTLHIKVTADVYGARPLSDEKGVPEATTTFDLRAPWTLVAADAPTVRAIDDPGARAAVEAGIHVQEIAFRYGPGNVQARIKVDPLPVPIAYSVLLRSGGKEWNVGSLYVGAHGSTTFGTGGNADGLTADRADVVLRPDPAVAANTIDITGYWNGEVVIKDMPVTRPPAGQ